MIQPRPVYANQEILRNEKFACFRVYFQSHRVVNVHAFKNENLFTVFLESYNCRSESSAHFQCVFEAFRMLNHHSSDEYFMYAFLYTPSRTGRKKILARLQTHFVASTTLLQFFLLVSPPPEVTFACKQLSTLVDGTRLHNSDVDRLFSFHFHFPATHTHLL